MFGCVRVATPRDATAIAEIYEPIVRDTAISFEVRSPSAVPLLNPELVQPRDRVRRDASIGMNG